VAALGGIGWAEFLSTNQDSQGSLHPPPARHALAMMTCAHLLKCHRASLKPSVPLSVTADEAGRWRLQDLCRLIFLIKGSL
jgi:hypothetical protein